MTRTLPAVAAARALMSKESAAVLRKVRGLQIVQRKNGVEVVEILLAADWLAALRQQHAADVIRHVDDLLHAAMTEELHVRREEEILRPNGFDRLAGVLHFTHERACVGRG